MVYKRRATTLDEQIEILKYRNLVIGDEEFAKDALKKIGYFRFKGYCLPYYEEKDKFISTVTFNHIYKNYRFDERLRLLVFQLIEHIEVELRSVIGSELALNESPILHYDEKYFNNVAYYKNWQENFEKLVHQSSKRNELYTKHYINDYDNTFPIWVVFEISDFGSLSKFYANLKPFIKARIARNGYGINSKFLTNWIYVLSLVRNICAHNGRLYDKMISIKAAWTPKEKYITIDRVFSAIFICKKLCLDREYFALFFNDLKNLIELYGDYIEIEKIGFPENWKKLLE